MLRGCRGKYRLHENSDDETGVPAINNEDFEVGFYTIIKYF